MPTRKPDLLKITVIVVVAAILLAGLASLLVGFGVWYAYRPG